MASRSLIITFPMSLGVPGGGPLDCVEMARHLSLEGADVHVIYVATNHHSLYPRRRMTADLLAAADVRKRDLNRSLVDVHAVSSNPYHYLLDGISVKKMVESLITQKRVDAVLGYWHEAAYLPNILRRRGIMFVMVAPAPYKLIFHDMSIYSNRIRSLRKSSVDSLPSFRHVVGNCFQKPRLLQTRLVMDYLFRNADRVLARSRCTRADVIDVFNLAPGKVDVSYCGVDSDFLAVDSRERDSVSNFLFFGALTRQKGVFDTIQALGIVASQGIRDWTLRIAGWGDETTLKSLADDHGISEHVEFLGNLDKVSLLPQLAWADLAILPSYFESFGLAIAEAQATGVPVVAYETGAVPEIVVHNVTGWLAPTGDVRLLAKCIEKAKSNPQKTFQMGSAARRRTGALFSWKDSARRALGAVEKHMKLRSDV